MQSYRVAHLRCRSDMSSRVLMIDLDAFANAVDAAVKQEQQISAALYGKDNYMAVFHGATAKAMHDLSVILIEASKVEKWD